MVTWAGFQKVKS